MNKFKVGDEVAMKGVVTKLDENDDSDYGLCVMPLGGSGGIYFTNDGRYHTDSLEPALYLLPVIPSDVTPFKDEIERLKNELEQTRNYYSGIEKELKSLREEKDTFNEEYSRVLEANDKLISGRELAESTLSIQLNRIVKLDAQIEILKQVIKELK